MEERFFRNVLMYFGDCQKHGIKPSVIQLMVFSMHNWMPVSLGIGFSEKLDLAVSLIFMVVTGLVGEWLLGYRASYEEYYDDRTKEM